MLDTVSMDRPGSVPCLPVISVRMKTIRSPFLPEIRAQSSGLVVLGRSSFSLNSSTHAWSRCETRSPCWLVLEEVLDRHLLGPVDDVLDHRAGVEVLEVQDLLVTVGVGHLEEAVLLGLGVHPLHGRLDHPADAGRPGRRRTRRGRRRAAAGSVVRYLVKMSRADSASGRSILIFTSRRPGPQDRRVDHVLAVGGADDEDVLEALDAVDLAEQLRDDGVLDVGGDPGAAGAEQRVHLVEEHDDRACRRWPSPGPAGRPGGCAARSRRRTC